MPYAYTGKILKVDLSTGQMSVDEHDEVWYRTYWGGSCLGAWYMLKEQRPGVEPFSPDNLLIFATGVPTGIPAPGFARHSVITKSAASNAIADTEAGGFFGPELKFAGYDAVVIRGKAEKPVYLWINDGHAEIRDASTLWGKSTGDAQQMIRDELGDPRIRVAGIGPAGENLVRFACVINELKHANGRTGTGAIMGSKNLKAIAARGHNHPALADAEKIRELAKWFSDHCMENPANRGLRIYGTAEILAPYSKDGLLPTRNFQTSTFEHAEEISAEKMNETILVEGEGCYACAVRCKRVVKAEAPFQVDPAYGGPEYETMAAFGSNCGVADIVAVAKANELCNRYSLDTIATGSAIAFAMECYENGLLSQADCNGLDLRFGNGAAMVQMVEDIAFRRGLGDTLAEGTKRAAEKIGRGADKFAVQWRGVEVPMHEPRVKGMLGISYATAPIGADHVVVEHDTDFDFNAPQVFLDQAKSLGILRRLPTHTIDEDKLRMYYYLEQHFSFIDTLDVCVFTLAPVRAYTMDQLVDLVSAASGWECSLHEIMKAGERRVNMFQAFNIREGFRGKDDWLPDRFFQPISDGPRAGYRVDPEQFRKALRLYRRMHNWDPETAIPYRAKLVELDLAWVADELAKHTEVPE